MLPSSLRRSPLSRPIRFADDALARHPIPSLERPTLRSLGAYWIIKGDKNANATVRVDYRKKGDGDWRQGPPMFRVEKGAHKPKENEACSRSPTTSALRRQRADARSRHAVRPEAHPRRSRRRRGDEDARPRQRSPNPSRPPDGRIRYVVPGDGGGRGTQGRSVQGHADAAESDAKPGDTFLLAPGRLQRRRPAPPQRRAGQADHLARRDERRRSDHRRPGRKQRHRRHRPARRLVRGPHDPQRQVRASSPTSPAASSSAAATFSDVDFGLAATKNDNDTVNDYFVTDNVMRRPHRRGRARKASKTAAACSSPAPATSSRTTASRTSATRSTRCRRSRCDSIDIHNNDVDVLTDDGIETDYSQRNVRVFENRLTNVFQGISTQPVYGGPVYIFRNAMFNVSVEPFKMHNGPSGAIILHNTIVKAGAAACRQTPASR